MGEYYSLKVLLHMGAAVFPLLVAAFGWGTILNNIDAAKTNRTARAFSVLGVLAIAVGVVLFSSALAAALQARSQ